RNSSLPSDPRLTRIDSRRSTSRVSSVVSMPAKSVSKTNGASTARKTCNVWLPGADQVVGIERRDSPRRVRDIGQRAVGLAHKGADAGSDVRQRGGVEPIEFGGGGADHHARVLDGGIREGELQRFFGEREAALAVREVTPPHDLVEADRVAHRQLRGCQ